MSFFLSRPYPKNTISVMNFLSAIYIRFMIIFSVSVKYLPDFFQPIVQVSFCFMIADINMIATMSPEVLLHIAKALRVGASKLLEFQY